MTPAELIGLAMPFAVGAAGLRMLHDWRHQPRKPGEPVLPPMGKAGPIDRFWHPLIEPIVVGDAKTEFFETHARVIGFSGSFKTTLLAALVRQRIEAGRPVVVLTGGDSDQLETEIRAHGGFVVRPENSPLRFNAFEGSPGFMAQVWAQLMPTASVAKVQHSAFELAALEYFESTTSYSTRGLKDFVMAYEPDEGDGGSRQLWRAMKENYVSIRMARVEKFLGNWIGDELSINDCVRHRIPVMFCIDSKDAPDLNELAAALVWQGMCYAVWQQGTTTGLDAFIDEFGRLPRGLVNEPIRTWRRNKSHLVAASHTDRDFDPILEDMFHVNILGRMVASATDTRKAASEMTWGSIHPTAFGAHALGQRRNRLDIITHQPRRGYFWLVDQERVQQVKLFTYKPPRGAHLAAQRSPQKFAAGVRPDRFSGRSGGSGDGTATTYKGANNGVNARSRVVEASLSPHKEVGTGPVHGPVACPPIFLPPFATEREPDLWLRHRFPTGMDGCYELDYYCNPNTGRPEMQWRGSPAKPLPKGMNNWMAYAVVRVLWDLWERGWPLDSEEAAQYIWQIKEETKSMQRTVGHIDEVCGSIRCGRREHTRWLTNRANVAEQKVLQMQQRQKANRGKTNKGAVA